MLNIKVMDSSFDDNKKGFNKEAIDRWKKSLRPFKSKLLKKLLGTKMKKLGYI